MSKPFSSWKTYLAHLRSCPRACDYLKDFERIHAEAFTDAIVMLGNFDIEQSALKSSQLQPFAPPLDTGHRRDCRPIKA